MSAINYSSILHFNSVQFSSVHTITSYFHETKILRLTLPTSYEVWLRKLLSFFFQPSVKLFHKQLTPTLHKLITFSQKQVYTLWRPWWFNLHHYIASLDILTLKIPHIIVSKNWNFTAKKTYCIIATEINQLIQFTELVALSITRIKNT